MHIWQIVASSASVCDNTWFNMKTQKSIFAQETFKMLLKPFLQLFYISLNKYMKRKKKKKKKKKKPYDFTKLQQSQLFYEFRGDC